MSDRLKVIEFYIEKSERTANWTQLIAKTEDGNEYVICGSYCGGIPESHWDLIPLKTQKAI